MADSLDRAVDRLAGPAGGAPASLFSRWAEIVGPSLAPHTKPLRLADGVLVVTVDQPARATAVRAQGSAILQRAHDYTGAPADRLSVTVTRP